MSKSETLSILYNDLNLLAQKDSHKYLINRFGEKKVKEWYKQTWEQIKKIEEKES